MRLRNIKGSREMIADSPYTIDNPAQYKGKWHEFFGNNAPIRIEVGMGKGKFISTLAMQNPDINYIGIEKYSSVLIRAIDKRIENNIENLYFLRFDAVDILDIFDEGEIDRIYLNFSDPWPKDRHAKRRLPSREYLARYDKILKKGGRIEFKTDNRVLFDWALEELPESAWKADLVTFDLHSQEELMVDNVMTEYEEKFSEKGNPICKYILTRK